MMHETEQVLKLSDMFEHIAGEPEIELVVKVININGNADILNKCTSLRDYMVFVDKVRMKKESDNKDIKTAVTEAVDECIDEGILEGFFRQHRDEVIDVSIYDMEKIHQMLHGIF